MKRTRKTEPDLFVVNQKLTAKEVKELSDFIKEHRKKQALLKPKKHRKAA
ncbi:MAG: hypothetical protein KF900_04790 [Bacteroidetes bacterium]|nr:hypothetical protein [Bacteroidota bacterium]